MKTILSKTKSISYNDIAKFPNILPLLNKLINILDSATPEFIYTYIEGVVSELEHFPYSEQLYYYRIIQHIKEHPEKAILYLKHDVTVISRTSQYIINNIL